MCYAGLDNYDIVWSGKDELLPPRESHTNPCWEVLADPLSDKEVDGKLPQKRRYNKLNTEFWDRKSGGGPLPVQPSPPDQESAAAAEGDGSVGQQLEYVPDDSPDTQGGMSPMLPTTTGDGT